MEGQRLVKGQNAVRCIRRHRDDTRQDLTHVLTACSEVVIVVTDLVQTVQHRAGAVGGIVIRSAVAVRHEAVTDGDQLTRLLMEYIIVYRLVRVVLNGVYTLGHRAGVGEEVGFTVNILPKAIVVGRTVVAIGLTARVGIPHVLGHTTVLVEQIRDRRAIDSHRLLTDVRVARLLVKVVPCIIDHVPSDRYLTVLRITDNAVLLKQTGVLGLTDVDAVFAQVVVVAVDQLNAGQLGAVHVVRITALVDDPTVLDGTGQRVRILKGRIHGLEITALFRSIIGIDEGLQTVDLLVLFLSGEGVQRVGTQIDRIADLTAVYQRQLLARLPGRIVLRRQLDAGKHAQGIGRLHIDRLRLVNPLKRNGQRVRLLVKHRIDQLEIFVDQLDLGIIHRDARIQLHDRLDLGQHADTLGQLAKEGPCRCPLHVSAGQHRRQIRQLLGDRDLRHVDGEGVGGYHILIRIDDLVQTSVLRRRVGHVAVPGKLAVTARRLIEVKGVLALLVKRNVDVRADLLVGKEDRRNDQLLDARILVTDEVDAFHMTGLLITEHKAEIVGRNGHGLVIVQSNDGQLGLFAVDRINIALGEIDRVGHDHVQRLFTKDLVAQHQLHVDVAVFQRRHDAVFIDRRDRTVGYRPRISLGQLGGVTRRADAGRRHGQRRADRQIIHLGVQHRVIKGRRARSRRNHDQRGTDRTGKAVGRAVDDRQLLGALFLSNEGRRSAAVEVDRLHAAGLKHDLRDLLHTTAAGEGLLTAVQNHEHDLAGTRDTDRRTAGTLIVVIARAGDGDLAVLDQRASEAGDTLGDLRLVNRVIRLRTDHRRAVLEDGEEAAGVDGLIFHAVHDQKAARLTRLHVVARAVDGNDNVVVGNVIFALGVAVLVLCSVRLIQHALHAPFGRIVILVVGVNVDVVARQVSRRDVIDHLLAVPARRLLEILRNAGCQRRALRLKDRKVRVLYRADVVACQLADVIRKGIAARTAQRLKILRLKLTRSLQGRNDLVARVRIVHRLAQSRAQADAVHTRTDEVRRTVRVRQILGEVFLDDLRKVTLLVRLCLQHVHHVQAVQVAVHIRQAERALLGLLGERTAKQIVLAHLRDQRLKRRRRHAELVADAEQVDQVARPTGDVRVIDAVVVVIGNVHRTEHVSDVGHLSVRQLDVAEILQPADREHLGLLSEVGIVIVLVLRYEVGKALVLVAGHNAPRARIVAIHARTNVLNDKVQRIHTRHLLGIAERQILQQKQILHKEIVVADDTCLQHGDLLVLRVRAGAAVNVRLPTDRRIRRRLGLMVLAVLLDVLLNGITRRGLVGVATHRTGVGTVTASLARRRNGCLVLGNVGVVKL